MNLPTALNNVPWSNPKSDLGAFVVETMTIGVGNLYVTGLTGMCDELVYALQITRGR